MIQRLASKTSDRLSVRGTACEHQGRVRRYVLPKYRKHLPLVVVAEMKETVPRKDSGKPPPQGKLAHIGDDPFLIGKMPPADIDHGRGRIDANGGMTKLDQIRGHWLGGAAAEIEDRRRRRQPRPEPVEPGFFKQAGACPALDPVLRLALVQIDDAGGFFRRHSGTHASRIDRTYSRSRKFEPISAFFLNGS